ncbi:hypothetical protein BJY00DRAFT_293687 [Aspergillus carlsbadensis]|nr:hypothetical protein BJY00DRAFT_293687 [Aspergillus carlsbadensis]
MSWSIEDILALLTLVITIPTSIIGTCAVIQWLRHRHRWDPGNRPSPTTGHLRSSGFGADLEMVPVARAFPRRLNRTASASLEEGMTSISYYYIQYVGGVEVRRPAA